MDDIFLLEKLHSMTKMLSSSFYFIFKRYPMVCYPLVSIGCDRFQREPFFVYFSGIRTLYIFHSSDQSDIGKGAAARSFAFFSCILLHRAQDISRQDASILPVSVADTRTYAYPNQTGQPGMTSRISFVAGSACPMPVGE